MSEFDKVIENMDSETYMKLFDFCTNYEFEPDEETKAMSDDELLDALK